MRFHPLIFTSLKIKQFMAGIIALKGTVKHYDWGGRAFIPSLLQLEQVPDKPFAEYWLGVHPQADCRLQYPDGREELLRDFLASDPKVRLGEKLLAQFNQLPYLFKALDVKDMLSIQVHPAKAAAEADFAEENKRGIPLDAPHRNYKDANHKPELAVAQGPFWLLHGFRPEASLKAILQEKQALQFLEPVFDQGGYKGLYQFVMEMPQEQVNQHLQPILEEIIPLYQAERLDKMHPDFWAARAAITFNRPGRVDRGIFSVYLFNLVYMEAGQAIFQDAGVPHAYLEGQNIEIMASSDNVLRGGLTTKHIDVAELLKHTRCEATEPRILAGEQKGPLRVYKTPAPDFELSSLTLPAGESFDWEAQAPEIYLLTQGEAQLEQDGTVVELHPGSPAAIQLPGRPARIRAIKDSVLYKAAVPVDK
jgi:mannose-6-phosphate isomerase